MPDSHRKYYDHEPVYRRIAESGGQGWEDRDGTDQNQNSYAALEAFLKSEWAPAPAPGIRALDLGCGGGEGTLRLALCGYEACGIDYSETAVELARRNAAEIRLDARFSVDDCTALETLTDRSFDLIVDHHVLHCLTTPQDRASCLAAVARLLKPGGKFFSATMSAHGELDFEKLSIDPVTRRNHQQNRYWVMQGDLNTELERAGLKVLFQKLEHEADPIPSGDLLVTIACRADSQPE